MEQAVVHFVRTDRRSERYSERIQAELGPVIGQPLDPEEMDERLSHFYGSDNFEALDYRLVRDGVLTGIEVSARRKSWGPNFLRFGLELQEDFEGSNSFNAGVRAQVTEVNSYGAEWQTDLQVGVNPRFQTEFYQPIGYTSNWFVVPRLLIERQNFDIFEGDEQLATYRVNNREVGIRLRTGVRQLGRVARRHRLRKRQPGPAGRRPGKPGPAAANGLRPRRVSRALQRRPAR